MAATTPGARVLVQADDLAAHGQQGTVIGHYELLAPLVLVKLDDGATVVTPLGDLVSAELALEPPAA